MPTAAHRPRGRHAAPPPPPVDVLPGCTAGSAATSPYANGQIPSHALCALPGLAGHALRADAARPGTSKHGWGVAVDLACGSESFGTNTHDWLTANARAHGWHQPSWAQRGGSRPEPWHWELRDR